MSQFDALLDFGESTPAANGTVQQTDDFDPFGASPTIDMKGSASADLMPVMGDFTFDGQVSQQSNGTHKNETDVLIGFNSSSNNINPLYDLINASDPETDEPIETPAVNSVPSSNPLYEMSTDYEEPQKPDMATEPANPLYGYVSSEDTTNGSPSEDLMGTSATVTSDDSGVTMDTAQVSEEDLIMVSGDKPVLANKGSENVYENISVVNGHASSHQEEVASDEIPREIIQDDSQEEAQQSVDQELHEEASETLEIVESREAEDIPQESVQEVSVDDHVQGASDTAVEDAQQEPDEVPSQTEDVDIPQEAGEEQVLEPVRTEVVETEPVQVQAEEPVDEPQDSRTEPEQIQAEQPVDEPQDSWTEPEQIQAEQPVDEPQDSQPIDEPAPAEPEQEEENWQEVEMQEEVELPEMSAQVEDSEDVQEDVEDVQEDVQDVLQVEVPPQEEVCPQEEEFDREPQEEVATYVEEVLEGQLPLEKDIPTEDPEPYVEVEEEAPYVEEPSVTEDQEEEDADQEVVTERTDDKVITTKTEETTMTKQEDSGPAVTTTSNQSSEVVENGINDAKENQQEIRFDDMANIKTKFESGGDAVMTSAGKVNVHDEILNVQSGEYENEPTKFDQWQNTTEGGVYENQPQENPDVFKEGQTNVGEELPEVGMAKNVLEKFKKIQEEGYTHSQEKRELTPDRTGKYEYVSEPRTVMEKPKEVVEAGVFESQPAEHEDVVRSSDHLEDAMPEQGSARNLLAKFKQYESEAGNRPPPSPGLRELTPDRNTKGEYVSEPRTLFQQYEGQVESGEFESQPSEIEDIVKSGQVVEESLPEKGSALNLVSKFKQYQSESASVPSPRHKKELTPDRSGKTEYVSEPRRQVEMYEGKSEAGIFESSPVEQPEVVKCGDFQAEPLPEEGYAKNVAAKFRELEKSGGSSPSGTPRHKEFTPPREDSNMTVAGVLENTPESLDIARESDSRYMESELPERGMAKNMLNKFKEIQANSPTSPRNKKEFTPPPDHTTGIFENKPAPSIEIEAQQAESGILESTPQLRDDVAREDRSHSEVVPEEGHAKNMVNRWKQMESESAKSSPSPRYKDFTPPRDQLMSPKSPAGMNSSVNLNDLPGQYQEQVSGGVYENTPEQMEGIYRESDTDYEEGLPAKDTTRALLQRFKSIQDQAKEDQETPKPISRKDLKENGTDSPAPEAKKLFEQEDSANCKKPSFVPILDKCAACGKTVYALEKMEVNKNLYHRACVRCSHCKAIVTSKNMSVNEGVIFCTPHFKQLFARRGNYDEGFGRHQYKKKWTGNQNGETS